jgi:hypothetical protein
LLRSIAVLALIAAAVPATAHAQDKPAKLSAEQRAATDLALARGRLIYAYDQAAWHGTDAMVAKIKEPEKLLGGWIVDGPASSPTLIFFDKDAADPHAVYIAEFRDNKLTADRVLDPASPERTLSPERKAMIAALQKGKQAWRAAKPVYCADRSPNSVVLPPERPGGPHLVYILTPQVENLAYPLGGHFRIEIGADGRAGASRGFTKSCITMKAEPDMKATSLFITHLLDPVPTEIHVFTSLTAGMPVGVGTTANDMLWWVTGSGITGEKLKK